MANYLYNGIELPALPNWDKTLYPYVYITNGFLGIGRSYVCFQTIQYGANANGYYSLIIPAGTGMSGLYSDNQWSEPTVTTEDKSITIPNEAWIWANFDVLNEDGSVFLAASDPIPVGKPITDPMSFMVSYNLGCRLRAQRGRKPIGYSYNGTVLPALPQWDKSKYPYLVIFTTTLMDGTLGYVADALAEKPAIERSLEIPGFKYQLRLIPPNDLTYTYFGAYEPDNSDDAPWITPPMVQDDYVGRVVDNLTSTSELKYQIFWAPFDIYYAVDFPDEALAGTLYRAADPAPVPVYK